MKSLKEIAEGLYKMGIRCNCDLDNWQPFIDTGYFPVCRIDKGARYIYHLQDKRKENLTRHYNT